MDKLIKKVVNSLQGQNSDENRGKGYGVMAIGIGPFAYHVTPAPGVVLTESEERDMVAIAICKNIDRILDKTGKYDVDLSKIFG